MINVLIPALGKSTFYADCLFPKLLYEVQGKPMIEHIVQNLASIKSSQLIFIFDRKECIEFHLDDSVRLLTANQCKVMTLKAETAGALCSSLMAISFINNKDPLMIVNADQIIDVDYQEVIDYFLNTNVDAGVIGFKSVHPRWSYYHVEENGRIDQVAEKYPLSDNAIAGCYFFKSGELFIEYAKQAILKRSSYEGKYYISAVLNEIILDNLTVQDFKVPRESYHSFYSPEKVVQYEKYMTSKE